MYTIQFYFLVFLSYSVLGWILETIVKSLEYKRFINRGFLIGPYLPIYGVGGLLATFLLYKYRQDIVVLFFLGIAIFSVLEYSTSLILEIIFHARWWDYSNDKFNLNGRISLNTMIPFGLLGVAVIKFINPIFFSFLGKLDSKLMNIIFVITSVIFVVDLGISFNVLQGLGSKKVLIKRDNTEEARSFVTKKIKKLGWPYERLVNAFPGIKIIIKGTKNFIGSNIKAYNEKQQKIRAKTSKKIKKIKDKYNKKITKIKSKYNRKMYMK